MTYAAAQSQQGTQTKVLFNWMPLYWLVIGLLLGHMGQFDAINLTGGDLETWKQLTGNTILILALNQLAVFVMTRRHVWNFLKSQNRTGIIRYGVIPVLNIVALIATASILTGNLSNVEFHNEWSGAGKWLLAYFTAISAYESLSLRDLHLWGKLHATELKTTLLNFLVIVTAAVLFNQFYGNLGTITCSNYANCAQTWFAANDLPGIVMIASFTVIMTMMAVGGIRCLMVIQDSAFVRRG